MGSLYLSSLYLGALGGATSGQLTTDDTATNLFWNGSQLNNQGGGGGGGAIAYVSSFTVSTTQINTSSILSYLEGEPISIPSNTVFTGKATVDTELNGKGIISITGSIRGRYEMIVSTLGNDDVFFTINDLGLKFILTTSNFVQNVYLPDPSVVLSGFNFVIANSRNSSGDLALYDYNSNSLFNLSPANSVSLSTDGSEFFGF
jgi:hypothetical protein